MFAAMAVLANAAIHFDSVVFQEVLLGVPFAAFAVLTHAAFYFDTVLFQVVCVSASPLCPGGSGRLRGLCS